MRKSVVAAWLALSSIVAAVPAAADSPISLPPLAPGEVLAEVTGLGVATNPATRASIRAAIAAPGDDDAQARRKLDDIMRQVTAAARAAGVAAADIEIGTPLLSADEYAMTQNMSTFDVGEMNEAAPPARYARMPVTILIRNPRAAAELHATLTGIEHVSVNSLDYALDDNSAPRRAARADAVRRARADAESYAASMNMRVSRVLRVTERIGSDISGTMLSGNSALLRDIEGREADVGDGTIRTYALVGVDYALAPR
jgi:uncharacterized protein YggE